MTDKDKVARDILSDITVHMKYARYMPEKERRETWAEIVDRNKAMHIKSYPDLREEIDSAYKMVYDKKVLPSMRSMQFGGKPIEVAPNRIYNCAFAPIDDSQGVSARLCFCSSVERELDTAYRKHHVEKLPEIQKPASKRTRRFLVNDSIEGWADAVKALSAILF